MWSWGEDSVKSAGPDSTGTSASVPNSTHIYKLATAVCSQHGGGDAQILRAQWEAQCQSRKVDSDGERCLMCTLSHMCAHTCTSHQW